MIGPTSMDPAKDRFVTGGNDVEGSVEQPNCKPKVLIVRLLEACNAGCFMCDFARSQDKYRFNINDAIRLAEMLVSTNVRLVRFTGGEPLLMSDIAPIVRAFSVRGMSTSIITNGAFLEERAAELIYAGLGQVIVSLDGAGASSHDKFRRTPGLFETAIGGIRRLVQDYPDVVTRVNTVVGVHNVAELITLYRLLGQIGVSQWSLIPLKEAAGAWSQRKKDFIRSQYTLFKTAIDPDRKPLLLGYSRYWLGRDETEIEATLSGDKLITPRGPCRLVDSILYYIPKTGKIFPCNCVPHRQDGVDFGVPFHRGVLEGVGLTAARKWLREHGPTQCRGCEPINAALGDSLIDLEQDFAF